MPFFNVRPSVAVFMHFFELRLIGKVEWVSLNVASKRMFDFNTNVFRRYKEHFFKVLPVRNHTYDAGLFFEASGEPRFPFYWKPFPRKFRSYDIAAMSPEERVDVGIFTQFLVGLDGRAILALSTSGDPVASFDSKLLFPYVMLGFAKFILIDLMSYRRDHGRP